MTTMTFFCELLAGVLSAFLCPLGSSTDQCSLNYHCAASQGFRLRGGLGFVSCPLGTFKAQRGEGECSDCPIDSITMSVGSISHEDCVAAPGYTAVPLHPGSSAVGMHRCPAGTFKPTPGNQRCTPCPAGSFSRNPGAFACPSCPPGAFYGAGSVAPQPCPVGSFRSTEGAQAHTDCNNCAGGTIAPTRGPLHGTNKYDTCPQNEWSDRDRTKCLCKPGLYRQGQKWECTPCKEGTYRAGVSDQQCTPCPIGAPVSAVGSVEIAACKETTIQQLRSMWQFLSEAGLDQFLRLVNNLFGCIGAYWEAYMQDPGPETFEDHQQSSNGGNKCMWSSPEKFESWLEADPDFRKVMTAGNCRAAKSVARRVLLQYHPDKFKVRFKHCNASLTLGMVQRMNSHLETLCRK